MTRVHEIRLPIRPLGLAAAGFAAIVVAAHLLSSPVADLLRSGAVVGMDNAAHRWAQEHASARVVGAMRFVSDVHGTLGILVLAAVAAWAWSRQGHPGAAWRLALALPAGMLLNFLVKIAIQRARPDWALVALPGSYSFPSGHVAESTVFYGSLVLERTAWSARVLRRTALALLALAMVALVACSRVVLGVHYLSDCVGAVVEGLAWLAACFACRPSLRRPVPARHP